jgi:hypothetical protein
MSDRCQQKHPDGRQCVLATGHEGKHRLTTESVAHACHWPGCRREVPPAMWGCKSHWFMLPKYLRDAIWRTYVPGQEITKTPSREYLDAADNVQQWIKNNIKPEMRGQKNAT